MIVEYCDFCDGIRVVIGGRLKSSGGLCVCANREVEQRSDGWLDTLAAEAARRASRATSYLASDPRNPYLRGKVNGVYELYWIIKQIQEGLPLEASEPEGSRGLSENVTKFDAAAGASSQNPSPASPVLPLPLSEETKTD